MTTTENMLQTENKKKPFKSMNILDLQGKSLQIIYKVL